MSNNLASSWSPKTPPPLSSSSSEKSSELVINNQDLIFEDVLPSFEMHNYMFNRTILDTEYIRDSQEAPPTYENNFQTSTTSENPIDDNRFVDPTMNPDMLVLNNLDNLQFLKLPIKLTVMLTKKLPEKGKFSEREAPLKEYKPGDIVTGYILIENTSKEPIPFEMFLVSLEGTVTTRATNSTDSKKLIRNNFLKMYDLCACYHIGRIDVSYDITGGICPETGAEYGFRDKVLLPGKKYKKQFMFRLPTALLDTCCEHQSPEHLMMPSSFGVDTESFNGRAAQIQVDEAFGYGHLGDIGSPFKTRDLSEFGQSISYSVNVRMIGRRLDFYKRFYTPKTTHDYDFIFLQDLQYFFRVSTAGTDTDSEHCAGHSSNWYFKTNFTADEQMEQLQKLVSDKIEEIELTNDLIEAGVDDPETRQAILNDRPDSKKFQQLQLSDDARKTKALGKQKMKSGVVENVTAARISKSLFSKCEGELVFELSTSSKNSIDAVVPERLKKMSYSTTATKSLSSAKSISPTSILHSNSSKSFKSSSKSTKKSESLFDSLRRSASPTTQTALSEGTQNFNSKLSSQLSTYSSSSLGSIKVASDKISISLTFNPKRGSTPPESITIKPLLEAMNLQSEVAIPFTVDGLFLMESSSIQTAREKMTNLKKSMLNNLRRLHDLTKQHDLKIPKTLYNDLISITKLNFTMRMLSIFKKIQKDNLNWVKDDKSGIYHTDFDVDLIIDEKTMKENKYHIIPNFQTCLLDRFYAVKFELECGKSECYASLPINVV